MDYYFVSPYLSLDESVRWLRGNHHSHSTVSDGGVCPEEEIRAYDEAQYDYFALSDHDTFVDPQQYQRNVGLTLLPAVEITSYAGQTLMFLGAGTDIPAARSLSLGEIHNFVEQRGGLFIVDHPNWVYQPDRLHATTEEIFSVPNIRAIEIYTGVIERMAGSPLATDVWDRLLTKGMLVYGHATDDQHSPIDRFLGWNCVQQPADKACSAENVIKGLAEGRFYASTGVNIEKLGVSNDLREIIIDSDADLIRWIVRDGALADITEGGNGKFGIDDLLECARIAQPWPWPLIERPDEALYVRAELIGKSGRRAWSQPFLIRSR